MALELARVRGTARYASASAAIAAFAGRCAFFSCRWNKINARSLDGTLFDATSVDATQSLVDSSWRWNKINASSRDGTLFVTTDYATQRIVQRDRRLFVALEQA